MSRPMLTAYLARLTVFQILQELTPRPKAGHKEKVPGPSARHVVQVPFRLVHIFEVGIICYLLDSCL